MEDVSGEATNTQIWWYFIMALFILGLVFMRYLSTYDVTNYTDAQISRNGGLTAAAMQNINQYIEVHYENSFSVESLSGNDKKDYGEEIEYVVKGKVPLFFDLPDEPIHTYGSAISMVR